MENIRIFAHVLNTLHVLNVSDLRQSIANWHYQKRRGSYTKLIS
jgi:hypothetical protein